MQPLDPGIVVLLLVVSLALLSGFLLFIAALMGWLNLRRLRLDLHADLTALRAVLDRLAGTSAAGPQPAEPGQAEAVASATPSEPPAPDKIGFSCPECGRFFEGPSTLSGTTYTCPECRVDFHIH